MLTSTDAIMTFLWLTYMFQQRIPHEHQIIFSTFNHITNFEVDMCDFPINTHNNFYLRKFCSPWILKAKIQFI